MIGWWMSYQVYITVAITLIVYRFYFIIIGPQLNHKRILQSFSDFEL